jgi:hypothetical protein
MAWQVDRYGLIVPSEQHLWQARLYQAYQVCGTEVRASGAAWPDAHRAIIGGTAALYGVAVDVASAAISANTPINNWDKQVSDLGRMLDYTVHSTYYDGKMPGGGVNKRLFWEIIKTGNVALCTGFKRWQMHRLLMGDRDAVPPDIWLVRAALGANIIQKGVVDLGDEQYKLLSEATRTAAADAGVCPAHFHCAVWLYVRRLYKDQKPLTLARYEWLKGVYSRCARPLTIDATVQLHEELANVDW